MTENEIASILAKERIIPVVTIENANDAIPIAKALIAGNINSIEVTFRTECAYDSIKAIKEEYPEMTVGAGTVINNESADKAIDAGCDFVVSPGFNPENALYIRSKGAVMIPGVCTPGEIERALYYGFDFLKFFPAEAFGGVKTLKALSQPFPNVKWMPTGGINEKNIKEYLEIKNVVACGGSFIVKKELVLDKNFKEIERLARMAAEISRF